MKVRAAVRCSGVDTLATAEVCLTAIPALNGTCPTGTAQQSTGCHDDVPCVVSASTSHCGRCPAGSYGNGSVCERKYNRKRCDLSTIMNSVTGTSTIGRKFPDSYMRKYFVKINVNFFKKCLQ